MEHEPRRTKDRPHLLAAPDKFRGTASAREIAAAAARAGRREGWSATARALADGGDGLLEAVGGKPMSTVVTGPLGTPVSAEWRLLENDREPPTAVIEMARASGLALVGGPSRNDPLAATTRGTGELVRDALAHGVRRVVVGCGGSATTDGGAGLLEVIGRDDLAGVELLGACDVTTPFLDAAIVFAAQKGAGPSEIELLSIRLEGLATRYRDEFGVDVTTIERAGAAGGLGGALAVLGGRLVSGFALVADLVGLDAELAVADLVVTGEGRLDATSFEGKVVGEVLRRVDHQLPVLVVVGDADAELGLEVTYPGATVVSLVSRFGLRGALADPAARVEEVVLSYLRSRPAVHRPTNP